MLAGQRKPFFSPLKRLPLLLSFIWQILDSLWEGSNPPPTVTNPFTDSVLQCIGKDALPAGLIQSPPSKKLHQLQNQVSKKGGWVEENYCERAIKRPAQVCQQFKDLPRSANMNTKSVPHWYHTDAALVPNKSNMGTTQVPQTKVPTRYQHVILPASNI